MCDRAFLLVPVGPFINMPTSSQLLLLLFEAEIMMTGLYVHLGPKMDCPLLMCHCLMCSVLDYGRLSSAGEPNYFCFSLSLTCLQLYLCYAAWSYSLVDCFVSSVFIFCFLSLSLIQIHVWSVSRSVLFYAVLQVGKSWHCCSIILVYMLKAVAVLP